MSRWREVWRHAVGRVAEHVTRARDAAGVLAVDFIDTFEAPQEPHDEAAAEGATATTTTARETVRRHGRLGQTAQGGSVVSQDTDVLAQDYTPSTTNSAPGSSSTDMSHDGADTEAAGVAAAAMAAASSARGSSAVEDGTRGGNVVATDTITTRAAETDGALEFWHVGEDADQLQRDSLPPAVQEVHRSPSDMQMHHRLSASIPPSTIVGTEENDSEAPSGDSDSIIARDPSVRRTRPEYRDFLQHLARVLVSAIPGQLAGADDELIERFAIFTVREGIVVGGERDCPICLDALSGMLMMLPCWCVGHVECMTSALRADVRCPLHRIDVRVHVCARSSRNGGPSSADWSSSSPQHEADDFIFGFVAFQDYNTSHDIARSVSTRAAPSDIDSNSRTRARSRSDLGMRDSIQELDNGGDSEARDTNRERMESRLERVLDDISIQTERLIRDLGHVLFDLGAVPSGRQIIPIAPENGHQPAHQISGIVSPEGLRNGDSDEALLQTHARAIDDGDSDSLNEMSHEILERAPGLVEQQSDEQCDDPQRIGGEQTVD
jgi:hypothetical protein